MAGMNRDGNQTCSEGVLMVTLNLVNDSGEPKLKTKQVYRCRVNNSVVSLSERSVGLCSINVS